MIRIAATPLIKRSCLKTYVDGIDFWAVERVRGVHHTTVITGVKQVSNQLLAAYVPEAISEVDELAELQTFVGSKKTTSEPRKLSTTSNRVS